MEIAVSSTTDGGHAMVQAGDLDLLESQLQDERKKVDVATHNFSVREIVRMVLDEELNVAPAYQRKFRWDEARESLFIESIFLGLPIPPLFVATNVGFQWEIVDGLQRVSTLVHYMAMTSEDLAFTNKEQPLALSGLEKLSQLNGSSFSVLPKNLQVYFGRQPLQVISLTDKSDLQVRFDVFERLNKGAIPLSPQEVRACVYGGRFNDFVDELSRISEFSGLLKLQEKNKHDGTASEQVLKFFAYKNFRESFDGKVERFLNRYMLSVANGFDYAGERQSFINAASKLHEICGQAPFLRSGHALTPLVQFEACIVAIAELQRDGIEIVTPEPDWLTDEELRTSSTRGSNTNSMLRRRLDRAKVLLSGRA
jgi:hypothetical protein